MVVEWKNDELAPGKSENEGDRVMSPELVDECMYHPISNSKTETEVSYNIIQHHKTSYNIIHYQTTSYNITQHHTTLYNIIQHHTTLYNITQHHTK